jgi:hypothetical protein
MKIKFTTYVEVEVEVEADIQPAEAEEENYPGCEAGAVINSCVLPTELTQSQIDSIQDEAMDLWEYYEASSKEDIL